MSYERHRGQSLVEFALILPIFILIVIGVFDLGRAFFAFIAISNAAREGVRVYTFDKKVATITTIHQAIAAEIGSSTVVDQANIDLIEIHCTDPVTNNTVLVNSNIQLKACKEEAPISVTITYLHPMILSFFFPSGITLVRSAEMMVP